MIRPVPRGADPDTIGLLAGNGVYPLLLAERLTRSKLRVVAAGIRGQTDSSVAKRVDRYSIFAVGAIRRTAAYFLTHGAGTIYLAGGIKRPVAWRHARPDRVALGLLIKNLTAGDDALLRGVATAFSALGIAVGDPRPHLGDLLAGEGRLAGPSATPEALADLEVAWAAAKKLGARDRGQAATAFRGQVTGLEGLAGTDALIASADPGAVLAKTVKPHQDPRFDLPAVGPSTAAAAQAAGLAAIAVEAGGVLLLERSQLFDACNRHQISLIGFPSGGPWR